MGWFGLGGGDAAKIERLKKRATNPFGQAVDRQVAMKSLYGVGTPEAIEALMERFSVAAAVSITDHDEKRQVYEWLLEAGDRSIVPIERFVATHDGVYWPLRALKEIAGIERAVDALLIALDRAGTVEIRVNEQRAQLVSNLRDFQHPKVLARLRDLCRDPNDDVRIMAVDGIMTYGEAEALPILVERMLDPDEGHRMKGILYEQLLEQGWSLAPWQAEIEEKGILPGHYRIGPGGKLMRAG